MMYVVCADGTRVVIVEYVLGGKKYRRIVAVWTISADAEWDEYSVPNLDSPLKGASAQLYEDGPKGHTYSTAIMRARYAALAQAETIAQEHGGVVDARVYTSEN